MKILKSLTTAAVILLLVGCAGRGSEDSSMPVPVHERETVPAGADANTATVTPEDEDILSVREKPSTPATTEAPVEQAAAGTVQEPAQKTVSTEITETTRATEETPAEQAAAETVQKPAQKDVSTEITETARATEETPAEQTAAETVQKPAQKDVSTEITGTKEETVAKEKTVTEETVTEIPDKRSTGENLNSKKSSNGKSHWYAGAEGALAFAESTFSSFGAGGTHAGGSGSLFAGYKFNGWLSLEVFAGLGQTRMTARECCSQANLWLSKGGEQFRAAVLGKEGGYYGELESSVFLQNYGLRLNFDILALIPSTKGGKWSLELAPAVSALGSKAKTSTASAEESIFSANSWQLGLGGRVQAGYAVLPWVNIGVFTGLTFGTGRHIDALPADGHKSNFIWESGARLTFSIPDKTSKKSGR